MLDSLLEGASGIGVGVVVGRAVLVKVDSVGVGLNYNKKKYIWKILFGTIPHIKRNSITVGDLLNGKWVD